MRDPLVRRVTVAVQDVLAAESERRAASGEPALTTTAQQALAIKTVHTELASIDQARLRDGAPRLSRADEDRLTAAVLAAATGLGPVDVLLDDETIEEVSATRYDLVWTYHSDGRVELLDQPPWGSEAELADWVAFVARTKGRTERQFNSQHPLLVMRIGEGLRLAATRDVARHVTFSLRRNRLGKVTLADLVGLGMFPTVLGDLFRAFSMAHEMRWVVSGATSAGKTTLVRAMLHELPPQRRLVVIEDTAEIDAFDEVLHPNVESWERREPNSEGQGEVSIGELVAHGLRYRPDLLTVGECRDSATAVPMLKAMTHGQSSVTTVHAYDARGGLDKLALFLGTGPDQIPLAAAHHQLSQAVDFLVHVDRGVDGRRFVAEVVEVAGFDGERVTTNTIYEADSAGGQGHTLNRLTDAHSAKLHRAGFDSVALGSVWR
jgi:pilus assembly protein CpaF